MTAKILKFPAKAAPVEAADTGQFSFCELVSRSRNVLVENVDEIATPDQLIDLLKTANIFDDVDRLTKTGKRFLRQAFLMNRDIRRPPSSAQEAFLTVVMAILKEDSEIGGKTMEGLTQGLWYWNDYQAPRVLKAMANSLDESRHAAIGTVVGHSNEILLDIYDSASNDCEAIFVDNGNCWRPWGRIYASERRKRMEAGQFKVDLEPRHEDFIPVVRACFKAALFDDRGILELVSKEMEIDPFKLYCLVARIANKQEKSCD